MSQTPTGQGIARSVRAGHRPNGGGSGGRERLGPYTLHQRVGEGGMGIVYLATDSTGRAVALKVLRDHVAGDPAARTRLEREFATLQRVRHPRIAPVLDADVDGPRPYLVTRYVQGPPLDRWVRERGPLAGSELADLGRGLAESLAAIHAAGVVHRDLKPGNVLMPDSGPVVIDFGIAHVADEARLTSTGLVMGTPGYLPPELLDGAEVSEATDWWGWAATLAFAATGRAPFGKGPMDAIFHRVYRGDADLAGVDARLAGLLRAALDPDPARRPGRDAVLAGLTSYQAGGDATVAVAAPGPPEGGGRTVAVGSAAAATTELGRDRGEPGATAGLGPSPTRSVPAPPATREVPAGDPQPAPSPAPPAADPPTQVHAVTSTRTMPAVPGPQPGRPPQAPYAGFHAPARPQPAGQVWQAAPPAGPPRVPAPAVPVDPAAPAAPPAAGGADRRSGGVVWPLCALAACLVALAASLPVLAVFLGLVWAALARTVYSSALGLMVRRHTRGGPSPWDVPRALVASPFRLVGAALVTFFLAAASAIVVIAGVLGVGAVLGGGAGWNGPVGEIALAVGMAIGVLLAWWGPGGAPLRQGSRLLMRGLAPAPLGPAVLGGILLLVASYLAVRSQATGAVPTLWPIEGVSFSHVFGS